MHNNTTQAVLTQMHVVGTRMYHLQTYHLCSVRTKSSLACPNMNHSVTNVSAVHDSHEQQNNSIQQPSRLPHHSSQMLGAIHKKHQLPSEQNQGLIYCWCYVSSARVHTNNTGTQPNIAAQWQPKQSNNQHMYTWHGCYCIHLDQERNCCYGTTNNH